MNDFQQRTLGPFSSHPQWVKWRRDLCLVAAGVAVPLFLLMTVGAGILGWIFGPLVFGVVIVISLAAAASVTWAGCAHLAWVKLALSREEDSPVGATRSGFLPTITPAASEPPMWLRDMRRDFERDIEPVNIRLSDEQSSPPAGQPALRFVFGVTPTHDQATVLQRFDALYRDAVEGAADSCCDLLIEGPRGSGRTRALLACAITAAFVRGQRVLLFAPDALRQRVATDQIRRFLDSLDLDYYLSVAVLEEDTVARWLAGDDPIPNILVGSLDSLERDLYGFDCAPQQLEQLRRLAMLPEVVLVDDLLQFEDAQRLHLPLVLDKHRLLLAAEMLPMQTVVACGPLSDLGRQLVAERLFTLRHAEQDQHTLVLRPPRDVAAWHVRWPCDDVPVQRERLVQWSLDKGHTVVVYRPDLDEDARGAYQERLSASGKGRPVVVSQMEHPLSELPRTEVDVIVYEEELDDAAIALRLHAGHNGTVMFCVAPAGAPQPTYGGVVPVFASRYAGPLTAAHLRSVARVTRSRTPIRLELWHRLGVDPQLVPAAAAGDSSDTWWSVDDWTEQQLQELWPYIAMESTVATSRPVSTFGLPDPAWGLAATPARDQLVVTRSETAQDESYALRRARWYDGLTPLEGLGEIDLAHATEFKLHWRRLRLGLDTMQRGPDGIVRLIGRSWQQGNANRCQGVYDLRLTIGDALHAENFWGGTDDAMRWFQLAGEDARVEARIIGLTSQDGQTSDIEPLAFHYPAHVSGLVLRPQGIDHDQLSSMHHGRLKGQWSSEDRRFWGALCGSVGYALRVKAPGSQHFSRVLAHELTGDLARLGTAIVWIVEPASGGRTASRLLAEILRNPAERANFFSAADWFLRQVRDAGGDFRRFYRQHVGTGLSGDDRPGNANGALQLISPLTGS